MLTMILVLRILETEKLVEKLYDHDGVARFFWGGSYANSNIFSEPSYQTYVLMDPKAC